ncbi:hypothetical protein GCM10010252_73640 [Streptomyces aureoverticillatus]|nr:hypothetical protein GCM10010252_73640 [Streptomyces aureoverticillatus]
MQRDQLGHDVLGKGDDAVGEVIVVGAGGLHGQAYGWAGVVMPVGSGACPVSMQKVSVPAAARNLRFTARQPSSARRAT